MEKSYRIKPIRSVVELLKEAPNQSPPVEPNIHGLFRKCELVDLTTLGSGLHFDIRYASANNFVGTPLYPKPRAFLQKPAAEALMRAHARLAKEGYGLLIYDCYRPWYITWVLWHATPDHQKIFLLDPNLGSRHNRGCAVDLGMYNIKTKKPVDFPSGFDEMTTRAFSDYPGGTKEQNRHRKILRTAMEAENFKVHPKEWWHFDYKDWMLYGIQNIQFDDIA